jgi:hypothetical protein
MNNLIRSSGGMPTVGQRDGNWIWNGSNWVCDPNCDDGSGALPPFGPPVFSGPVAQPPWYPGANGGVSFGATAPPNPVRGHMWWNGTTFYLFDGAAWVPIGGASGGGGTATGSTPPANPFPGQMWFNGSVLFVWDGNAWVPTSTTRSFVQTTAPPAPNPGDTWFDGVQQRIWDGSAWRIVGPGATVGPVPTTTKVFQLQSAATVAIGVSYPNWGIVPFTATPVVDSMAGWNATTHQYKPTTAGYYLFFTNQAALTTETAAGHALLFNDNGSWTPNSQGYVTIDFFYDAPATAADFMVASGIVHMNGTTDFVRLWATSSDGNYYQLSTTMPSITGFLMP